MNKIIRNLFYLFLPLIIGSFISLIINNDFTSLNKPFLAPPKIVFPIVWTILYLLMGIAYYLYRKKDNDSKAIFIYYLQLIVNALWSIIFFNLKWRFISIIWIILLLFLVITFMNLISDKEKISFYLFIPYFLWLIFATYLNIGFYILN